MISNALCGIAFVLLAIKNPIYNLNVVKEFPNEMQMEKGNLYFNQGTSFDISGNEIFCCDQFGNKIIVLDLEGNFRKTIGRQGQGPGEFNLPRAIKAYKEKIYVLDNGNGRVQIFSTKGEYLGQIKVIDRKAGLEVIDNKLYVVSHEEKNPASKNGTPFIKVFDLEGRNIGAIFGRWKSKYNKFDYDNYVTIQYDGSKIFCLQKYGVMFKTYNVSGDLILESELSNNPFDEDDYKKLKYAYAYQTFCIYDNKIFASRTAKNNTIIDVFDEMGTHLFRLQKKHDNKEENYHISDMKIIERDDKIYLFMLYTEPDMAFSVALLNKIY